MPTRNIFLWGWDSTNSRWTKLVASADGALTIQVTLANLDDIGDVDVGAPSDQDIVYWDDGAGAWQAQGISNWPVVLEADFDANTILYATLDDTPVALTVTEQTVVGRLTGGNISAVALGIADNNVVQIDAADVASGEYAKFTANGLESKTFAEVRADLNVADGADVTGDNAPQAHKDSHDPNDGGDPLDTAAPNEITGVKASAVGTAHSLARSDHDHQVQAAISDDHLLTVDDAAAADNDFARFTANGIEGLTVAEAIAALLGAALPENTALILDAALSADGKYSGIVESGTAGAALSFGNIVYQAAADSRWELAKADAASTSDGKLGICVLAAAGDGSATTVLLWGKVRADAVFPAMSVMRPVYISAATAGLVTSTAPSGTTNYVVRIVGYANTADELYFCPDNTYIELA